MILELLNSVCLKESENEESHVYVATNYILQDRKNTWSEEYESCSFLRLIKNIYNNLEVFAAVSTTDWINSICVCV